MKFFKMPSFRWTRNSDGQPDAMLTFALVSFVATTMAVVLSFFDRVDTAFGSITFAEANVPLLTLYFGGAFTSYIVRRNTKAALAIKSVTKKAVLDLDKVKADTDYVRAKAVADQSGVVVVQTAETINRTNVLAAQEKEKLDMERAKMDLLAADMIKGE